MAATVAWQESGTPQFRHVAVTFGASDYATGGYTLSAASLGFTKLFGIIVMSNPSGYVFEFNPSTSKLIVYRVNTTAAQLAEVPAGTNLGAVTLNLLIVGQ